MNNNELYNFFYNLLPSHGTSKDLLKSELMVKCFDEFDYFFGEGILEHHIKNHYSLECLEHNKHTIKYRFIEIDTCLSITFKFYYNKRLFDKDDINAKCFQIIELNKFTKQEVRDILF